MDKNKKIIVGVVAIIMVGTLIGAVKFILFSEKEDQSNGVAISIPIVDEKKIDDASKMESYNKEPLDSIDVKFMNTAENIFGKKPEKDTPFTKSIENRNDSLDEKYVQEENTNEQDQFEEQLERIMAMQKQMEIQEQMEMKRQIELSQSQYSTLGEVSPALVTKLAEQSSDKIVSPLSKVLKQKNHFHGAVRDTEKSVLDLVPVETIDQGVIVNGSTVAIRTKREMKLQEPKITIPKDAVLYGKVVFNGTDRLQIDIESYKKNTKLYRLKMDVYDFDGRKGVHLGNRTWSKIPSVIANDVYDYAYTKGTQGSTFGGGDNSEIKMEEAKKVAILSATKEISKEVFDKRRVFMPRKYHLWINLKKEK